MLEWPASLPKFLADDWSETTTIVRENSSNWFYTSGDFSTVLSFDTSKVLGLSSFNESVSCTLAPSGNILGNTIIFPVSATDVDVQLLFTSDFVRLNGVMNPYVKNYFMFTYVGDCVVYTISPVMDP